MSISLKNHHAETKYVTIILRHDIVFELDLYRLPLGTS